MGETSHACHIQVRGALCEPTDLLCADITSIENLFWITKEKQGGGQQERAQGLLERVAHGYVQHKGGEFCTCC